MTVLEEARALVADMGPDVGQLRRPVTIGRRIGPDPGDTVGRLVVDWLRDLVDERGQSTVACELRLDAGYISRVVRGERGPGYRLVCAGVQTLHVRRAKQDSPRLDRLPIESRP